MVVHICCAVDSHYFLQALRRAEPDEPLVGYFYDPNIHPYGEYYLRLLEVRRSCQKLGIPLVEGEYDVEAWLQSVRGLEEAPEKGARCSVCFDTRLAHSAEFARSIGDTRLTTTLFASPKKSLSQLQIPAQKLEVQYGVTLCVYDFRKEGGTQRQFAMAKVEQLYKQEYCGCLFAYAKQKEEQERFADEMRVPLGGQVEPCSLAERIEVYEARIALEEAGVSYTLHKQPFLAYRLLRASVKRAHVVLPSYVVCFSLPPQKRYKTDWTQLEEGVAFGDKFETRCVDVAWVERLLGRSWGSVQAMLWAPPQYEQEWQMRDALGLSRHALTPVIVLDRLPDQPLEIAIESLLLPSVRENLVKFG